MTLNNIRTRILERCGRAGDTTLNDTVTYALENVQDEVISDIIFPELLVLDQTSLLLVADTQEYSLPDDFDQMIQIWDTAKFNQELTRITPIEYKMYLGDVTGEHGTNPIYYDILGSGAVSSTYRKKIKFYLYPETILNGAVTTFTDYSGTVAGTVEITDASHGLATGDSITIAGTTNYNGVETITKIDDNNFYITATYVAEAGGATKTWIKNYYIPFVYMKGLAYLSDSATENVLSYMYPQLYIEGGAYYLYRDVIYRDMPEKIAFRRAEFERVKKQVQSDVIQPDWIRNILPKRYTASLNRRLYRTQYSGYTS